MTLLLAAIVIALLATGWVVYPLLRRRWVPMTDVIPGSLVESEARKRAALSAIRDAEYDHAAGKLDEADYAALRAQLEVEAVSALRRTPTVENATGIARSARHVCGFVNPAGSRFCAGCGKRLD